METAVLALAHFVLVGVAQFAFVFLKSFQQRNVAFDHYLWIVPTSFLMAVCEVYVISRIAITGFGLWIVFILGLSGGFGSLCATVLHRRWLGKKA